jgi:hypothetical protein
LMAYSGEELNNDERELIAWWQEGHSRKFNAMWKEYREAQKGRE